MKNKNYLYAILIIAVVLLAYFGAFGEFGPTGYSILAVSKVYIERQNGSEDPDGEWVGSEWVVLSTSSTYDQHIFYRFDANETEKYGEDTVNGQKLIPKATIIIEVDVGRPYVESSLTENTYLVCPKVYGLHSWLGGQDTYFKEYYAWNPQTHKWEKRTDGPLDETYISVKETVGDWQVYVPLKFTVTKYDASGNGVTLVSDDLENGWFNMSGPSALIPITFYNPNDPDETMKIKLEGQLGTGSLPSFPSLAILNDRKDLTFEKNSDFLNDFRFEAARSTPTNYINYWYGYETEVSNIELGAEWKSNPDGSIYVNLNYSNAHCRGVVSQSGLFETWDYPKPIYVYQDPPPDPSGKTWLGLINYLRSRHRVIENWEIDKWGLGWDILGDKVRVYMPYNSFVWMYTIRISTELADTYVYRESLANGRITKAVWESTGTDYAEIMEEDTLLITVKNLGYKGNVFLRFKAEPSDIPILVSSDGKIMEQNETETFKVKVRNLGPDEDMEGTLHIECVNDAGEITDVASVRFKLLKKTGPPILSVLVIDKVTHEKITGLQVSVTKGDYSESRYTGGGWAVFFLPEAGTYKVTVHESAYYYSAEETVEVTSGSKTITIEVQPKAPTVPQIDWSWLFWILLAGIIIIIIFTLYKKRRAFKA